MIDFPEAVWNGGWRYPPAGTESDRAALPAIVIAPSAYTSELVPAMEMTGSVEYRLDEASGSTTFPPDLIVPFDTARPAPTPWR